ncbi:MAG: glycosyltransferase [Rickettsiales bacterium]|nr:glycosyltransferase [Rickettsiales bacterium]
MNTIHVLDNSLPTYSILVPLYKEVAVIPQLFRSIQALDYPKSKLDVKIILEEDDHETIKAVEQIDKPSYIDVIIVPHSLPKTKPKACNYAARYIRGDYVTIYDAEDVPEVDQLKKAVYAFEQADERTVCFQARLNYYNRHVNYLSRFFAIEYSIWFNILLQGLYRFGMPVPLGGTSNHISVRHLKKLGYWDPYNVTEDADLGLRIAQEGYKVGLLDSTTWEESPLYLSSWLKQRSRWLKGYLQTYIIHMRSPRALIKKVGIKGFIGINIFVGAPPVVYLLSPVIWSLSIIGLLPGVTLISIPNWIQMLMFASLAINILLHIILAHYAIMLERWRYMRFAALLFPFYNLLNIFSSYKVLWQLFTKPHFWEKTTHGIYLKEQ